MKSNYYKLTLCVIFLSCNLCRYSISQGIIKPGDAQWMTAGRGIIHEEYLSPDFLTTGGILEMAQLWVNLPAKDKMTKPRYQEVLSDQIPELPLTDEAGTLRVIAGMFDGVKGSAKTFSPIDVWDVKLKTTCDLIMPDGYNTILFVRKGSVRVAGESTLAEQQIVLMSKDGNQVKLEALKEDTQILVLSGMPLDEPIEQMGPFVMNTRKEIQQAVKDYQDGKMGR